MKTTDATSPQVAAIQSEAPFLQDLQANLSASHIPALDGLRALAVFLVIFYHAGLSAGFSAPGGIGVLAFFVLSGFLVTWLLLQEFERSGIVSIRKFYARRALRIFPAFYCYLVLILCALLLTGKPIPWAHVAAALFYVSNYYNAILGDPNTFVSHTWYLAVEGQFYLLWPVVFLLLRRDLRCMSYCLVGVIGLVWAYRTFLHFEVQVNHWYIYEAFDTRVDHLMVGCLLAVILKTGSLDPWWQKICSRSYLPAITLAVLGVSGYLEVTVGSVYRDLIGFVIDPILVAVLMVQLIVLHTVWVWRWIEWPVTRYLGRISYSLYLYQQVTVEIGRKILPEAPVLFQLGLTIAVTVIIASGSYALIERPFLKLKDRIQGNLLGDYLQPLTARRLARGTD